MLSKNDIKKDIKAAFESVMYDESDDRVGAIDRVADKIAETVVSAIKSATINYTDGLTAPNGPVTGVFNGNLT